MINKKTETAEWKRLYDAAARIRKIAPWEFMLEEEVFCIEDPVNGMLCFLSVMGSAGEHFAVSAYLGVEEYRKFQELQDAGPLGNPEMLLEISQLQVSFENKSDLEKEDRKILKDPGIDYKGPNMYPMFRSFRDGYFPWSPDEEEIRLLTVVLEQAPDVLTKIKNGLVLPDPMDQQFLVRYPAKVNGKIVWKEEIKEIEFPEAPLPEFTPDDKIISKIQSLPSTTQLLEFDFSLLLNPIQPKKSDRPFYAAMALLVDHRTGMVLGTELFGEKFDASQRLAMAPGIFLKLFSIQKSRPKGIDIVRGELYEMLEPIFSKLGIRLRITDELPMYQEAYESLQDYLRGPAQ